MHPIDLFLRSIILSDKAAAFDETTRRLENKGRTADLAAHLATARSTALIKADPMAPMRPPHPHPASVRSAVEAELH